MLTLTFILKISLLKHILRLKNIPRHMSFKLKCLTDKHDVNFEVGRFEQSVRFHATLVQHLRIYTSRVLRILRKSNITILLNIVQEHSKSESKIKSIKISGFFRIVNLYF